MVLVGAFDENKTDNTNFYYSCENYSSDNVYHVALKRATVILQTNIMFEVVLDLFAL
tara:strand:- start:686 stop:856 length:171 start_codon:yes stop_codon:yes gene_type:complete